MIIGERESQQVESWTRLLQVRQHTSWSADPWIVLEHGERLGQVESIKYFQVAALPKV